MVKLQPKSRRVSLRGEILGDKDILVGEMIGRGGMGDVYKAKQLSLHRDIAVKIIKGDTGGRNDARDSFLREAIVTGNLEHPNIVPVYDVAETSDGHLYYLMKEIKGDSWEKVLEEKSLDENLEILLDVCDAIAYAHSRHVIHRDLKPENVMLGEYGEVVVMDWGIAATTKPGEHLFRAEQLTAESDLAGTLDYMPPEMVEGDPGKIGPKSDIYLLGGILYRIVTGMSPHPTYANMLQTIAAISANIIRPTDKQGELVDIALKALDADPGNRFGSVKEFQDAIRGHRTHSESISLFEIALNDYNKALNSNSYEDFSESVFGFRESVKLWPGNQKASEMIDKVLFSYGERAYSRGDYDLSISLLNTDILKHAVLAEKVAVAKRHRLSRKRRIEMLTRISIVLVVALIGILSVSTSIIYVGQKEAISARGRVIEAENMTQALLEKMQRKRYVVETRITSKN